MCFSIKKKSGTKLDLTVFLFSLFLRIENNFQKQELNKPLVPFFFVPKNAKNIENSIGMLLFSM